MSRPATVLAWRRGPESRPLVLGHRGARHAAPENTLGAFELAAREGADGVELDVRLDGDGRVIVLHDRTLERVSVTRDPRDVELLGARELGALELGGGERVPLLAEVLDWAALRERRLNIELKHDVSDRAALVRGVVWQLARRRDAAERVLLSSFHAGIVWQLSRALPTLPVAWLVHQGQRLARHARFSSLLGASGVNLEHVLITGRLVRRLRAQGVLVGTWTINDGVEARRVARLGVDAIITDRPGAMLTALAR
ncbi:MAG: glycerophosphodiester phosphodiesterase [Sorangiineae bacterium]|nr:glycerophosphodiester phosphodiesterase [Polyangiaceae bacterium]MEB2322418.1 glycerophosphodiester phosphodiesterase [Sorangiineae bacterium]